jgi:AraC family transcriptional regulator, regulatory protein of adaptative response / methylated-DNA-[protein]-cysteine methyltransferase
MTKRACARFSAAQLVDADASFQATVASVVALIERPGARSGQLPLDLRGIAFQERVWRALLDIPRGETRTYSALAAELGEPGATRAVARACGQNPLAVAVPCHRVVGKDGSLRG